MADRALHYVVPFLYVVWWIALLPHGALVWADALRWLAFPALYAAWILAHGAIVHEYPYPFMDVDRLGYGGVLENASVVGLVFVALGLGIVAMDRALARRFAAG